MPKTLFSRLPVAERFIHYWGVFTAYVGAQLWIYILISLLGTITDSLGISLFFPLLNGLQNPGGARSRFEEKFAGVLESIGLSYNVQGILISILVVFLFKALFQFAAGAYQAKITSNYLSAITKRSFSSISSQEYRHFLSRNIGVLANIPVNETYRAMVALMKFAALFPSIIAVVVFSAVAFRMDPVVTVAAGIFGGLVLGLTRSIAHVARKYSIRNTAAVGELNGLVLQSFGAYKYLRATMSFNPLRRQAERTMDQLANTQLVLSTTSTLSQALNEPVVVVFVVAMVWERTVIAHQPISEVVVLALFFFRLIKEVMNFQGNWQGFSSTMGSVDHITTVINQSEAGREVFSGAPFPGLKTAIRFENVTFAYDKKDVLNGVNLEIPKNAMIAVVGESGSGKSTFVDLLTGIQKPGSGRILLDEQPFASTDVSTFRTKIGFVTQEPALFNDTIANNISFWDPTEPASVRAKVVAAAKAAHCLSFLEAQPNGLETVLGDRGVNLSGGQRQRVAIARELYKHPDLLILDEATSALDSETEVEIQKSIEALKGHLTTVVIAHRLSTIRNADIIYVFAAGKVVESGTFEALYEKRDGHFRKFCELQGIQRK